MDVLRLLSRGLAKKARKMWNGQSTSSARGAPLGITLNCWFGIARPDWGRDLMPRRRGYMPNPTQRKSQNLT
jgi:hypothetical protein